MAGGVLCVLFTDLAGSTELMTRLGDAAFDRVRAEHFASLREAVTKSGGDEVKTTGDGLLATFTSAVEALAAATRVQQATDRHGRSAGVPLAVRVGLALGEVAVEDGDVFGTPVVEAARLVAEARPGQILATALVRAVAGTRAGVPFTDLGCRELKGLPDPVAVCEVGWERETITEAGAVPLPGLLLRTGRVFVGRHEQIERLRSVWKQLAHGGRAAVFVGGEPGVGKTRLTAALAEELHAEGGLVLGGRCDEDLGVPYQPFVEALRHYVAHAPVPRLGRHAGELTRLVPEIGQLVAGLPEPMRSDPDTERYRLFDAVAAWLADVSAEGPVLLVLDDLQWAAKPTLLLLRHVLASAEPLRLLIVATYRDTELARGHPLAALLADVHRLDGAVRLPLTGLDAPGVAAYLEAAAGHDLDESGEALARVVWQETEGNCLFVGEVLRHLAESGALEQTGGRWAAAVDITELGIPEGVRDVVARRLARLPAPADRVLAVAAVVGLEFDPALVQRAGGFTEEAVLDALDEAARARLVVEVPGTGAVPRNRFAHALVRATIYDGLSAARRSALHRHVAEAIEVIPWNHLDDQLPALAYHWARSGAEPDKAIDYATEAGHRAAAQLAHDEAARLYADALALVTPDDPRRLELMIALGDAQHRAGDAAHRETLFDAARLARERRDADALARVALAVSRPGFTTSVGGLDDGIVALLEEAAGAAIQVPALRARVLASLAVETVYAADRQRRLRLSDAALALARDAGDPATVVTVLANRIYSMGDPSTSSDRLASTDELVQLAVRLGDPASEFRARWLRARALAEAGDCTGARPHAERCTALADDLGQPTLRWMARWVFAGLVLITGQIDAAERVADEAAELARLSSQRGGPLVSTTQRLMIRFEQGRAAEIAPVVAELAPEYPNLPGLAGTVAWAWCESGHLDRARSALAPLARRSYALPIDPAWLTLMHFTAEAVQQVGDVDAARTIYPMLAPYPDVWSNSAAVSMGVTAYHLGILAATFGETERAEAHLREAIARCQAAGAPAPLGRARIHLARLLARRGATTEARRLLEETLSVAVERSFVNVERRARAVLEDLQ